MIELTSEQWVRVQTLFDQAAVLPDDQREAFLDEHCADDAITRSEVLSLLRAEATIDDFLGNPLHLVSMGSDESIYIDRYRILERIGIGGMGVVYLANRSDDAFDQQVAVKVLRAGMDSEGLVRRFHLERQALAGLQHSNIARLIDGGATQDGRPYLVMEYVQGVPLDVYCRTHELTVHQRIELMMKVCDAVAHAHKNLVIHRDLKPSNVLVDSSAEPKLLDFGIAKVLDPGAHGGTPDLTLTADRLLTPRYASPEQVRGEAVTTATDVHALGLMLYELLTGVMPYEVESGSHVEIARVICELEPSRPSSAVRRQSITATGTTGAARSELRGDLDTIVMKAIEKDPQRRYATVDAMREDLRRFLALEPILARSPSMGYQLSRFLLRRRGSLIAASAGSSLVAFVAIALFIVFVMMPRWSEDAVRQAHTALLGSQQHATMYDAAFFAARTVDGIRNSEVPEDFALQLDTLQVAKQWYDRAIRYAPLNSTLRRERDLLEAASLLRIARYWRSQGVDESTPSEVAALLSPQVAAIFDHHAPSTQLDGLDIQAVRELGLLLILSHANRESVEVIRHYESLTDPDPLLEGLLGSLYLILGHYDLAYPRIRAAYEVYPESEGMTLSLAEAACGVGDLGRATRLLERAESMEQYERWNRMLRVKAFAASRFGEVDDAHAAYALATMCKMVWDRPDSFVDGHMYAQYNPVTCYEYGRYLDRLGDLESAAYWYARGIIGFHGLGFHSPLVTMCAYVDCIERWVESWTDEEQTFIVADLSSKPVSTMPFRELTRCDPPEIDIAFHLRLYTVARAELPLRRPRIAINQEEEDRFARERQDWTQATTASELAKILILNDGRF